MKRRLLTTSAIVAAGLAALTVGAAAPAGIAAETPTATPQRVDDFQLTDQTRLAQHLYYYNYVPAIMVMTRTNGSAFSRAAAAQLEKLNAEYKDQGVVVWALDSNLGDSRDSVAAEVKAQGLSVPVLMDEQQLVGESLGVRREGEVFVINPKGWSVAYRGDVGGASSALHALLLDISLPVLRRVPFCSPPSRSGRKATEGLCKA